MRPLPAIKPMVHVVDDNPAVRDAIRWLVEQVGLSARTYATAQEFLSACDPAMRGCLVLDIRMPGISGLDLQDRLQKQGIHLPVIIITGHGDVPVAVRAMKAGALEFLQKPFNDQTLLDAIHAALEKYHAIWAQQDQSHHTVRNLSALTPREQKVLDLLRHGKPNKVIAYELDLSVRTVEGYRARIMEKMGARSLGQLIEMVVQATPKG
ncbi:MAG: DNA-binding response regulator [Thiobacillus sp. 63-78]|uniref:response regulator transcription factor n=1 Tax=Thiobacillus sp. 63-78 TaxID=1895859 RepID=UPI0009623C9C|nr:response regulator transcription factor [Thiobacillus sp. 63-78]OJZ14588.1 MAG: DNA-binding response regulator [Thiobacillus sp. 63-78]